MALVGFAAGDTIEQLPFAVDALLQLRMFDDAAGRLNRSLRDIDGELLLVSQVTLACGWVGGRPSFDGAAVAATARTLFDELVRIATSVHPRTCAGIFQAAMAIRLVNDGPVTVLLDHVERHAGQPGPR
jgi:D-tyrosyl-tRNA(Tyr) deacylase